MLRMLGVTFHATACSTIYSLGYLFQESAVRVKTDYSTVYSVFEMAV
jgi:hypothetical protein